MGYQFIIGIWEFQVNRLNLDLVRDVDEYIERGFKPKEWKENPHKVWHRLAARNGGSSRRSQWLESCEILPLLTGRTIFNTTYTTLARTAFGAVQVRSPGKKARKNAPMPSFVVRLMPVNYGRAAAFF